MVSRGRQRRHRAEALAAAVDRLGWRNSPRRRDTVLKQYELIRAEVMTSLQLQQQILAFGIATLGLLAGAAFVGKNEAHRSDLLVVFVPLVAYLAVTIWFSEVMRMLRAGAFMMTLEKQLDDLDDGSLAWECTVARGRPRSGMVDPDRLRLFAVTLLFLTLAGASIELGWAGASTGKHAFAVVVGVVAVIVLVALFRLRLPQLEELLGVAHEQSPPKRHGFRFPHLEDAAPGPSVPESG